MSARKKSAEAGQRTLKDVISHYCSGISQFRQWAFCRSFRIELKRSAPRGTPLAIDGAVGGLAFFCQQIFCHYS